MLKNLSVLNELFYLKSETSLQEGLFMRWYCWATEGEIVDKVTEAFKYTISKGLTFKGVSTELPKGTCDKYQKYDSVVVQNPQSFTTLLQFEKYLLEHANAYVYLGSQCETEGDNKLVAISHPMFTDHFADEYLQFSLCEHTSITEMEKTDL